MSPTSSSADAAIFQLKGSMLSLTVLELNEYDLTKLNAQLTSHIKQAPSFFHNAPIILNLNPLSTLPYDFSLQQLLEICRQQGFQVLGIKSGNPILEEQAQQLQLALIPAAGNEIQLPTAEATADSATEAQPSSAVVATAHRATRVITHPIRSGQQIYAEGADLIVMSAVSAGAEILADGHIHVYGPLRGRALAGVKGDQSAMIFCQQMAAELVSIASRYKVAEDLRNEALWGDAARISLRDDVLKINAL